MQAQGKGGAGRGRGAGVLSARGGGLGGRNGGGRGAIVSTENAKVTLLKLCDKLKLQPAVFTVMDAPLAPGLTQAAIVCLPVLRPE